MRSRRMWRNSIVFPGWAVVAIVCLLGFAGANAGEGAVEPVVSRIIIDIREAPGETEQWIELARGMIFLREGESFTTERFKASVDALEGSGAFREIDIPDPEWGRESIDMKFILTPFPRIKDIKISGAFPILEREVLNAMSLHVGGVFREKSLPDQEASIERIFRNEGYVSPHVTISPERDPKDGHFILRVRIDKGAFHRVKKVKIEGGRSFTDQRLKLRIKTWKASLLAYEMKRFIEKELDEDIKNLIEFYREKQHPDVVVTREVEKDDETRDVLIRIIIDEGPYYDVEFAGNDYFWDMTLEKDLVLFSRGNRGGLGIRGSIREMRKRYVKAGFLDARIMTESEEEEKNGDVVKKITFIIEEGVQSVVESIRIEGCREISERKIKKQMLTRPPGILFDGGFSPETLSEDIDAIVSLHRKHGYMNVEIKERIQWRDDPEKKKRFAEITLDVREGVRTRIHSVTFPGLNSLAVDEALEAISAKQGGFFREGVIEEDEIALSTRISEEGHPHVKVEGSVELRAGGREAVATYQVNEGPDVEMGRVHLKGNFRTKAHIVRNEMELEPGEPFSLKKMLESQRNIRNIGALEAPRFKTFGLTEKMDRVDMLVEVEERKPWFFQASVGYDTEKEAYASVGAGDRNLLGTNKNAGINLELSQSGYRGELGVTEPRFFGTRIQCGFRLYAEELEELNKGYKDRIYGAALLFDRDLFNNFKAGLSFTLEHREQLELDSDATPDEDMDRYDPRKVFVVSPLLVYSTADSTIDPTRGEVISLSMDVSAGFDDARDDFIKYRFEARKYYTPTDRLTLAARGRVGWITPYGSSDDVFDDQLFFLGGVSTIRGFKENLLLKNADGDAAGGKEELLGNLEARIDMGLDIQLITFFDIGTVRDSIDAVTSDDVRYSAGLGLGYSTPVGAISILYGRKLNKKPGESAGRFHFAVGFTF